MTRQPRTVNFRYDFVKDFVCIAAIDYTTLQRLLGRLGKHKTRGQATYLRNTKRYAAGISVSISLSTSLRSIPPGNSYT